MVLWTFFWGFPVAFEVLFPGILSGIQGLKQTGPEWYCGPLNGIDRP